MLFRIPCLRMQFYCRGWKRQQYWLCPTVVFLCQFICACAELSHVIHPWLLLSAQYTQCLFDCSHCSDKEMDQHYPGALSIIHEIHLSHSVSFPPQHLPKRVRKLLWETRACGSLLSEKGTCPLFVYTSVILAYPVNFQIVEWHLSVSSSKLTLGICLLQKEELQIYEKYCQNKPRSEALWRQCGDSLFFQVWELVSSCICVLVSNFAYSLLQSPDVTVFPLVLCYLFVGWI